ncbi:MAG: tyrosine-type recombinase/integrase [Paracoccus sp. (in: a-proteobacteria)]
MTQFNTLSQLRAKNLPAGKYADGQGLWLVKRRKEAGKWMVRLTISGRRREMGLGPWPDVSIAEARDRAADARRQVRDGIDPVAERAKERLLPHVLTLKEAVLSCLEARKAELKGDGVAGRWISPLEHHVIPAIGTLPITTIDQHTIKQILEPIWHEKAETAAKCLNRLSLTLKHAAALGLDVDLQATMKARALLGKQRHEVTHIPAMPYQEVSAFYAFLKAKNTQAAIALRLLILTAARTSEVRAAAFDEFDLTAKLWTIPKERTKTGREHIVPLTDEAVAIVQTLRQQTDGDLLFPSRSGKPISDMAMSKLMRDAGYDCRPHGFRASFRTWAEECTDFPREVKEACLGHKVEGKVEAAYQRSERLVMRCSIISAWCIFVSQRP